MSSSFGSLSRRTVLGAMTAALVPTLSMAAPDLSLKQRAAAKGLLFGTAVQRRSLEADPAYAAAVVDECSILSPEWEMKWGAIERVRGVRDYAAADWLVAFGKAHELAFRGHTAAWANNMPSWSAAALAGPDGRIVFFDDQVRGSIGHFAGHLRCWDVVNEAVEPRNGRPDGLRNSILLKEFGTGFIDESFQIAKAVDPASARYYNDYGVEYATPDNEARRRAVLGLLERLRKDGVPVTGLGIQGHLEAGGLPFDPIVFRRFLREVADLGLGIMITEFDVNDRAIDGDDDARDRAVADMGKRFLDVALDEAAVEGVVTWGLSDRYTWLNGKHRWARSDGMPNRSLPLDSKLARKPLWYAIAAAFDAAPERRMKP